MKVVEKKIGGHSHPHSLQFVMPDNFDRIEVLADRFDDRRRGADDEDDQVCIHARLAVPTDPHYILKQHRWAGPEIERMRRKFYEKGAPIRGRRLSLTKVGRMPVEDVRASIAEVSAIESVTIIAPKGSLFDDLPIIAIEPEYREPQKRPLLAARYGGQIVLPPDMPPDIIDLAAGLGETHREIGEKLGLSRPHVTNVLCGRFRPSRRVVERVLELSRVAQSKHSPKIFDRHSHEFRVSAGQLIGCFAHNFGKS